MIISPPTKNATTVAIVQGLCRVYLQVRSGKVRIATTASDSLNLSYDQKQGLELSPADGIVALDWSGPLFARADELETYVDVQVVGGGR